MATPTLLGLPLELRRPIFQQLLSDLLYPLCSHDKLGGEYQKWAQEFQKRTAIMRVNHQLRNEAFPICNENLTLVLDASCELSGIP